MVEALDPVTGIIAKLRQATAPAEALASVESAFAFFRAMHGDGRSGDALPLALDVLEACTERGDRLQMRRSAMMCGLLSADAADIVGAIEHYIQALRLATADDDRGAMSLIWNNIGLAFGISGSYDNAIRCYRRALALVEPDAGARKQRHVACGNLADSLYHLGQVKEGITFAERALDESTTAIVEADLSSAVILRRNLVRLLIADNRLPEAELHVQEAMVLADSTPAKRARIAAEVARASAELAKGHADVALTRLDNVLERARAVPAALRDALACAIRSEEQAGHPARALMRLEELTELIYSTAVERARQHVTKAGYGEGIFRRNPPFDLVARARLESALEAPAAPEGWKALQRLAAGAALRMDPSGWHGMRVGALVKAFALFRGQPPLQALEFGLASELHDVGMMSIPEGVLAKRGVLNPAERDIVRRHTDAGSEILCDDQHPRMLLAREVAKYHHARWDGRGHPQRVGAEFIPLAARMCSIADAYDAMVCGLCGRDSRTMEQALQELSINAGSQFDPELVGEFDGMIRGEMEGRGVDLGEGPGMQDFLELIRSLTEDRGFV